MSLIRYRPLPMSALHDQISRMFEEFDRDGNGGSATFTPPMDVKEDADAFTVHLEVPGMEAHEIELALHDTVLSLRGTKQHRAAAGAYRRVERAYGSFARSISLPRAVDGPQVSATLRDGVLCVTLPKLDAARPRRIPIRATQQPQEGQTVTVEPDPDDQAPAPTNPAETNPEDPQPTGEPEGQPT